MVMFDKFLTFACMFYQCQVLSHLLLWDKKVNPSEILKNALWCIFPLVVVKFGVAHISPLNNHTMMCIKPS